MTDFASMSKAELARLPVRHQVRVFRGLLACHERLVAELEPPQPLDMRIALPARQDQAQRITLLRPNRFAVLSIGQDRVLEHLLKRNAARHHRSIGTFGKHPGARLASRPTSRAIVANGTPVHSDVLMSPCVPCTVFKRGLLPLRQTVA